MQGVLPEDYRSDWCKDHFDKQRCPRGVNCPFAHNLQQLRIDAAIKKGTVREDFKLNFCADEHQKGICFSYTPAWLLFYAVTDLNPFKICCGVNRSKGVAGYLYAADIDQDSLHLQLSRAATKLPNCYTNSMPAWA